MTGIPPIDPLSADCTSLLKKEDFQKILDAAQQFESLLVAQILKTARDVGAEGWLGEEQDSAVSSVMELAEEQFAQAIAKHGGLGLAQMIYAQLRRTP
jgi:flagellar protein FlgJ